MFQERKMNASLLTALKQITTQHGSLVLNDTKRMNALLSDLAPKESKAERNVFILCLEYGFHTELQNTKEDHRFCKNRLVQKLHSEEGMDLTLCNNSLDLLEAVLKETEKKSATTEPATGTTGQSEASQARPSTSLESIDYPAIIFAHVNENKRLEKEKIEMNALLESKSNMIAHLSNEKAEIQSALTEKDGAIEKLTIERNQSNQEKQALTEKLKSAKNRLILIIVFGCIVAIGWIITGMNSSETTNSLQSANTDLRSKLGSLQFRYDSLLSDSNKSTELNNELGSLQSNYDSLANDYNKSMEGIYSTSVTKDTLDESPMAYKKMDDIIENISPTAKILKIIKPIYNYKATEAHRF
jgi:hypothetical protein